MKDQELYAMTEKKLRALSINRWKKEYNEHRGVSYYTANLGKGFLAEVYPCEVYVDSAEIGFKFNAPLWDYISNRLEKHDAKVCLQAQDRKSREALKNLEKLLGER